MSARNNGQNSMPDEIQKAVSGDLNEEQVKEVEGKLSDEGKKQLRELLAIKAQRKSEEDRLNKAKEGNKAIEEQAKKQKEEADRARNDSISKAKAKFFEDYKISQEDQVKYSDVEFKKHDSGQASVDGILKDFVKVYGSLNAESLVEVQRKADTDRIEREKQAAIANAQGAGSHPNNPSGQQPPKFSEETQKIARESSITLEAADKIAKEGRHRVI